MHRKQNNNIIQKFTGHVFLPSNHIEFVVQKELRFSPPEKKGYANEDKFLLPLQKM